MVRTLVCTIATACPCKWSFQMVLHDNEIHYIHGQEHLLIIQWRMNTWITWYCIFMDESIEDSHGRDAKCRVYDEPHIGRVHECFYHATQQCAKRFWHFFWRVHSTSLFRTVKCRGHWTTHDHLQGSITRFDYGQFHMNTCSWGPWSFSCIILAIDLFRPVWDTFGISMGSVWVRWSLTWHLCCGIPPPVQPPHTTPPLRAAGQPGEEGSKLVCQGVQRTTDDIARNTSTLVSVSNGEPRKSAVRKLCPIALQCSMN